MPWTIRNGRRFKPSSPTVCSARQNMAAALRKRVKADAWVASVVAEVVAAAAWVAWVDPAVDRKSDVTSCRTKQIAKRLPTNAGSRFLCSDLRRQIHGEQILAVDVVQGHRHHLGLRIDLADAEELKQFRW